MVAGRRGRPMPLGPFTRRGLLVGSVLALASGCSFDGQGVVTSAGAVIEEIPRGGRPRLPRFVGDTLEGGHVDTDRLEGSVRLFNIWGSWCGPCREEAPALRRAHEEFAPRGVAFVGVDVRDNDAAARAFEDSFGIVYPSIASDSAGPALQALGTVLPQNAVPATVIARADGRVTARVVGAGTYATFKALLESALRESVAPAP